MATINRKIADSSVVFPTDPLRQTEFTVKLTDAEVEQIYREHRVKIFMDEMRYALEEGGYPEQDDETLRDMAETFMQRMENHCALRDLENAQFSEMMREDYPEIESEDE